MVPNYSGRLLDKIILVAAEQTSAIRENPDEDTYVEVRVRIVKSLAWSLWEARNELQAKRLGTK